MARIVTIAQRKGGVGKTSIAAHMASALAGPSCRVGLIDLDPQESLAKWYGMREGRFEDKEDFIDLVLASGWRAQSEIARLARKVDILLLDTPPHMEAEAKAAIKISDFVLVPLQLSPMDVWATWATLEIIDQLNRDALMVLNRVPARARLSDALVSELRSQNLPLAKTTLGNRTAFAASLLSGLGVTEQQPRSLAAAEMRLLSGEVVDQLPN
ncbi:MAG: ParA family partition ATPase [Pseudomonadota bacterium]